MTTLRYKKLIGFLVGVIAGIFIATWFSGVIPSDAKWKKIGKVNVSAYCPETNTPRNSYQTASGKKAKADHTVAVDKSDLSKYPFGTKFRICGTIFTNEDIGAFKKHGRFLDRFFDNYGSAEKWGVRKVDVYVWKKPKKKKKAKVDYDSKAAVRQKRQQSPFLYIWDRDLPRGKIVTDPDYIKGGVVVIGGCHLEVIRTEKGLGNKILTGSPTVNMEIRLNCVYEGAVG